MKQAFSLIALISAMPAAAQDTRQLDAHEHGVGTLNIAIEGTTLAMTFEAPGADIVGFEYAAKSDADLAAIDAAVTTLNAPLDLFGMPSAAACSVISTQAALESEDDHDDHGHDDHAEDAHDDHGHDDHAEDAHDDHGHDDHTEDAHDDHGHDDHAEDAHDDHGHDDHAEDAHDDHGHDDHAEESGHTEFHAEYTLNCENPDALTEITFAYFAAFPNAQEVEVQIISASGAQAFEVERDAPRLDLGR